MNWRDYQTAAQRTSSTHSEADKVVNGCLGLVGEAGEVVDVIKKHLYQDGKDTADKLMNECGDVLWYCAELCTGLGIDLDELMISTDAVCIMTAEKYITMTMVEAVMKLAEMASVPYRHFVNELPYDLSSFESMLCDIPRIIAVVQYILMIYCAQTVDACMDRNIKKLESRYPVGFDAERSNNRAPGDQ